MPELTIDDKTPKKSVGDHQYYLFPLPHTHENMVNRPTVYTTKDLVTPYQSRGSKGQPCNGKKGMGGNAKLLPEVHAAANTLMCALLDYGDKINDWSMKSAYIHNGFREDDDTQGRMYLHTIQKAMSGNSKFKGLQLTSELETEAKGVLGKPGDPRRVAFHQHLANAPGWNKKLADDLFGIVDWEYAPRGSNPHTTGLVFDLDFCIYNVDNGKKNEELSLGMDVSLNHIALQNAAGAWLNKYSTLFNFDSYNTAIEVFHLEYRKPKP
jgi:hypothetical protein